jgi:hypothetical protein
MVNTSLTTFFQLGKLSPMTSLADSNALSFRLGQLDAIRKMLLAFQSLYPPDLRGFLALRQLTRIWAQYREDRAISTGAALVGGECAGVRNAFLILLESIISPSDVYLAEAIGLARRMTIRPLAHERRETAEIVEASEPILSNVIEALEKPNLPSDPCRRLEVLVEQFRYSDDLSEDPLSATAHTPCWAINLASAARSPAFGLSREPHAIVGVVRRKMFRADRDADQRRSDVVETLDGTLHEALCDVSLIQRADQAFALEFTQQRSHSRLHTAWMLLYVLGALTPAQLARALPATKAGTAKLLRQLVSAQMAQHHGPYDPYVCTIQFAVAFPAWGAEETGELAAMEDVDDHISALADIED